MEPLVAWHGRLGLPKAQVVDRADRNGACTGEKTLKIEPPEADERDVADDVMAALDRYNKAMLQVAVSSGVNDLDGNHGRLQEKALRVAALLAGLENGGRIDLRHWARAHEAVERWGLYAHRLHAQVAKLERSPRAEIEDRVLDVIGRWQGSEKVPHI